ncbi:Smr domain protein [Myriangium duriaei CBS 260.36]|uniref:Smr domain protein n=1 Tax=Myriangium duriaei CBS 260.36 TaxID=1168546 RepID=A0A9P4J934_9PEZI|nr:Smr domain protein [Myriangium duriaei CBS 260.36]
MSHMSTRLGGAAFNHSQSADKEQEYDRLRNLARQEQEKHRHCAAESQQAYQRGDGAGAKQLSEEGKRHAQKADDYNRQASEFIFRENNATGRVDGDTIDLHGQYVEEAEAIVEQRIKYAKSTGQTHLHVIVGKGNHSVNHVQKIKPMVERVCQQEGLQYHTEENAGRMYIDLTGGEARPPTNWPQQPGNVDHPEYGKPHYDTAYPMGGGASYGYHQQQQQFDYEAEIKKNLPKVLRLFKQCCTVM